MMKSMRKSIVLSLMLLALALLLGGCASVEQALNQIGEEMEAAQLDTPQGSTPQIDWSFVTVTRDMATKTFTEGVPDATIRDTRVASKNGEGKRVIVVIEYTRGGKDGSYGFEYELNEQGEYELTRYGEGVRTDDLM